MVLVGAGGERVQVGVHERVVVGKQLEGAFDRALRAALGFFSAALRGFSCALRIFSGALRVFGFVFRVQCAGFGLFSPALGVFGTVRRRGGVFVASRHGITVAGSATTGA